ncbi:MAG: hypothetical protein RR405_02915 [Clostridia bacterium]
MEFKFGSSILFSNMGYVFKVLVWILLCVLLVSGIAAAIFVPIFNVITEQTDILHFVDGIKDSFNQFIDAEIGIKTLVESVSQDIGGAIQDVTSHTGGIVGIVFAAIFIYLLYCFLSGLSHYPMADIINNLMSSNLRFGFASNMALNFKKAVKFSGARLLITFPVDLLIILFMVGVGYGLFQAINLFALPIMLVFWIVFCSGRSILLSGWLPRLLYFPKEQIFTAFSRSFVYIKRNYKGLIKSYILIYTLSYLSIATFLLPSFGLIALLVPSIYYFLLRTIELISFYKIKGYCFYTDASTVIDTVEFGYRQDNQSADDIEGEDAKEIK